MARIWFWNRQWACHGLVWAAGLWLGLAQPALAVEGVSLIDQSCVAAGCFGGDTGGFPVQITVPGNYRLTSNLSTGSTAVSAIELAVGGVTLDLNGFSIVGSTAACACPATAGCNSGAGKGIYSTGALSGPVVIRNGGIAGFGTGIAIAANYQVEGLFVGHNGTGATSTGGGIFAFKAAFVSNGDDGLSADAGYVSGVEDSLGNCNADKGISVGVSSALNRSGAAANGGDGITVAGGSSINGCTTRSNGGRGIVAVDSTVIGNTAQSNAGDGIYLGGGSAVTLNTAQGNGGMGIHALDGVNASTNTARSNTGFGLSLGNGSSYFGNVLTCNNSGGVCDNSVQVGGTGINLGVNVCGTDTACP